MPRHILSAAYAISAPPRSTSPSCLPTTRSRASCSLVLRCRRPLGTETIAGTRFEARVPHGRRHAPCELPTGVPARLGRQDQAAAVIGKDVPIPLLLAIADAPEHEVRAELIRLQAAEFLYEVRLFPELEYTFKHALTHEVAYGGLLHDRQRALHARVTGAIERLAPERVAEQGEQLAHHALRGELWEKAVAYLRQAGLRAMAQGANREAIAHLEQALGALRRLPESRERTELTIDTHIDLRHACQGQVQGRGHLLRAQRRARGRPALRALWAPLGALGRLPRRRALRTRPV